MKSLRFGVSLVVLSLTTLGWAQSGTKESAAHSETKAAPASTPAQISFDKLKTLAGTWEGRVTTDPPMPEMKGTGLTQVTMRVTSLGNAMMHEMTSPDRPDDPITMLYVNNDQLMLTHYCDAGNRPRMTGKMSADGKRVEFDFLDLAGPTKNGHMNNAVFTFIDADHHTQDWTYILPGNKPVHAHFDLRKKKSAVEKPGKGS
jgi:hypothetical protein